MARIGSPPRSAGSPPAGSPARGGIAASLLPLVLALSAGACSLYGPPEVSPREAAAVPLEAWVAAPGETSGPFGLIWLSRPAYVAVFDIRPGAGVTALYPPSDAAPQRRFHAGYQTLPSLGTSYRSFSQGLFHPASALGFGVAGFSGLGSGGAFGCSGAASPVVYRMVVASEAPLRLSELRGRVGFAFRPVLGSPAFSFGDPWRIMQEVAAAVVPGVSGERDDDRDRVGVALPEVEAGTPAWTVAYTVFWSRRTCRASRLAHARPFVPSDGADRREGRSEEETPDGDRPADGRDGGGGEGQDRSADDGPGRDGIPTEVLDPGDRAFRFGAPRVEPGERVRFLGPPDPAVPGLSSPFDRTRELRRPSFRTRPEPSFRRPSLRRPTMERRVRSPFLRGDRGRDLSIGRLPSRVFRSKPARTDRVRPRPPRSSSGGKPEKS